MLGNVTCLIDSRDFNLLADVVDMKLPDLIVDEAKILDEILNRFAFD